MDPIMIDLSEGLNDAGDMVSLNGHIDIAEYQLGEKDFKLVDGLNYDLVVTNTGDGYLAGGIVRGKIIGTCDRCLEDAQFDIAGELEGWFLNEAPEVDHADTDDTDPFELVNSDGMIDVSHTIMAAVTMDTPYVLLCSEDCLGLCSECGANLNEGLCEHQKSGTTQTTIGKNNPFGVLADLKFDD